MGNPMLRQLKQAGSAPAQTETSFNNRIGIGTQIRRAMDYVRENGGDARSAFYQLAREKGVDPESILRSLH